MKKYEFVEYADGALLFDQGSDNSGEYEDGLDFPLEDDPEWRFWRMYYDDTTKLEISDEAKEELKKQATEYCLSHGYFFTGTCFVSRKITEAIIRKMVKYVGAACGADEIIHHLKQIRRDTMACLKGRKAYYAEEKNGELVVTEAGVLFDLRLFGKDGKICGIEMNGERFTTSESELKNIIEHFENLSNKLHEKEATAEHKTDESEQIFIITLNADNEQIVTKMTVDELYEKWQAGDDVPTNNDPVVSCLLGRTRLYFEDFGELMKCLSGES